ncbi:Clp protease N-terminal domain-containing protein [Hyphomicrobium sp.]|uniref:Clp protease N-terminal domain-containing protein n=1 Tax=Hyphomicrobium sp. TaxID=82 RepID=UPI002D77A9BE|nr:Clp protease N-terminal domain-containing protein [Hyphomicrobium sp.]HET6387754.1 Clp protease N-terminal domain-containing protein [Hyphomicrobium sp.]
MTATDFAQIPMSSDLAATLARGADFAGSSGAAEVSLEHVLAALCDDPDASAVLDASQMDAERLKADVVERVLANTAPASEPHDSLGVSKDVRRILEAAAAAARGSRRRDINGAIVLAAIVGDGQSLAAQILEAHGLTFDNAIRALQAALAAPREAPAPAPAPPPAQQQPQPHQQQPVADDVLARARERVQSRSAPSLRDIMNDMPRPAPPTPQYPAPPAEAHPGPMPDFGEPQPSLDTGLTADPRLGADPYAPAGSHGSAPASPASSDPGPHFGGEGEPQQRREPSFGDRDLSAPSFGQPSGPQAPEPSLRNPSAPEPSLPVPPRPQHGPAPAPEQHSYPAGPAAPEASPAPPSEIFSGLPPRPQPSRVLPPPIPPGAPIGAPLGSPMGPPLGAPAPSGPAGPRMRGPVPPNAPMGPATPLNAPLGPPLGMPGQRPNPGPGPAQAPGLGHDTSFRSGPPMGAPPQQRPAPDGKPRRKVKGAKGPAVEAGQLAENIPRTMRVGKTSRAEIRIAKASVKALTEGLDGDGNVWQHSVAVTKAMSVRLRAPEGGFFIESASPETQWIESNLGYASDDFASWRFLITPQSRGWSSLQIIVSARTVGADGVAAETALPDQLIEVKVRTNVAQMLKRVAGWTISAIIGGALATFGGAASGLMQKFLN